MITNIQLQVLQKLAANLELLLKVVSKKKNKKKKKKNNIKIKKK